MPEEVVKDLLNDMKNHVAPEPKGTPEPKPTPEPKDAPPQPAPEPKDAPPASGDDPGTPNPFKPLSGDLAPTDQSTQDKGDDDGDVDDLEAFKNDPDVEGVDIDKAPENYRDNLVKLRKLKDKTYKEKLELEKQLEQLQSQIASRPAQEEYEKAQAELKAARDRLGLLDVESTDEWRTQVSDPLTTTLSILKDQAAAYGVTPEQVEHLVAMEPKQQIEWIKDNAEDFSATFMVHKATIDRVKYNAKTLREKHPEVLAAHNQRIKQQAEQQKASVKERQVAAVNTAITAAQEMGIAYLKPVEGDDAHNAMVKSTMDIAKSIPDMPPEKVLRLAVMGAAAPSYHKMTMDLLEKNVQLNAKLDKIAGAAPRDKGVPSGAKPSGGDEKPKDARSAMSDLIDRELAKNT